jgi:hypothetical protein
MKEMPNIIILPARRRIDTGRWIMRVIMASFFALVGMVHLDAPDSFLPIAADWVPEARNLSLVTGLREIAGAIALLTKRLRNLAGPYACRLRDLRLSGQDQTCFQSYPRGGIAGQLVVPHTPHLAMQPVIVWCALFSAQ